MIINIFQRNYLLARRYEKRFSWKKHLVGNKFARAHWISSQPWHRTNFILRVPLQLVLENLASAEKKWVPNGFRYSFCIHVAFFIYFQIEKLLKLNWLLKLNGVQLSLTRSSGRRPTHADQRTLFVRPNGKIGKS